MSSRNSFRQGKVDFTPLLKLANVFFAEHKKNARPSTKQKHEKGQTTKLRQTQGGEKGDIRRPYQKPERK